MGGCGIGRFDLRSPVRSSQWMDVRGRPFVFLFPSASETPSRWRPQFSVKAALRNQARAGGAVCAGPRAPVFAFKRDFLLVFKISLSCFLLVLLPTYYTRLRQEVAPVEDVRGPAHLFVHLLEVDGARGTCPTATPLSAANRKQGGDAMSSPQSGVFLHFLSGGRMGG